MRTSGISVVLPNYNHARYITNQLNALISQSVRPLEVIVIDDGSTDDSVEVIEEFARKDPIIRLFRNERNLGVVPTVNRGRAICSGEYFFGVSADDVVARDCLERIEHMIDRYPEAGVYFGMFRAIDAQGNEKFIADAPRWTEETFASPEVFLKEYLDVAFCAVSPSPSTVYRKRYLDEVGGFRPELGHWCDTFAIRAIGLKYGACYTPEVLTTFRCLQDGFSNTQGRNIHLMLDIVARAAWLMRSPEFRDRFPESHVARWEKAYRDYVVWGHLLSMRESILSGRNSMLSAVLGWNRAGRRMIHWSRRAWARLLVAYRWRRLRAYVPDLSCYSGTSG